MSNFHNILIVSGTKMQTMSAISHFFLRKYKNVYNSKSNEIFFTKFDMHLYGQTLRTHKKWWDCASSWRYNLTKHEIAIDYNKVL